jgi:O-methyltransferase involved in polyketide biosynthesis
MDEKTNHNHRSTIKLTPEQETLLIPLYAKAQPENPLFYDPKAEEILKQVDYDFTRLRVPYKTVVLVCQRAKKIDTVTRDFLTGFPDGVVLHLGCGLDGRFWRVDNGYVEWYDLDMQPVIELRNRFFPTGERYHLITSSVTDLEWMAEIKENDRPGLVIAEGLLMYLSESDVRKLFLRLKDVFKGCRLIADVFSRMTARSATQHPSLKQTGAAIGWGIDDPHEIEAWSPGIHLIEEWFFTQDPDLDHLSLGYRLAYKLAGKFKMVQRAHRIVYYQL